MSKEQIDAIYEMVKSKYGDCVSVEIFVNSEGITVTATSKLYTSKEISMQTINGGWARR